MQVARGLQVISNELSQAADNIVTAVEEVER